VSSAPLRACLALAAAAALACACAPAAAEAPDASLEHAVAAAVNRHRAARKLGTLAWSEAAAKLARAHSRNMAAGRVGFGHDGFKERTSVLKSQLALARAAENVARQSAPGAAAAVAEEALALWLGSRVHRRNLEGPYQLSGVGASRAADGSLYLTQIFVAVRAEPAAGN
jgi:uncharacterized protein YkwD